MSDYFYLENFDGDRIHLPSEEARHLVKALRKKAGDEVFFTDGKGTRVQGVLEDTDYENCTIRIKRRESEYGKRQYHLHIAIAPTKNTDRIEWFMEKATELGIDEVTPIICTRSERKDLRIDRLQKIAVSAMKQSCQTYLPIIHPPKPLRDILQEKADQKFICHLDESDPRQLIHTVKKGGSVLLLVGPEGDFTGEELDAAADSGFVRAALGSNRLRTETAGLAACSIISVANS